MNEIRYVLFDAANTLIHKPALWDRLSAALEANDVHTEMLHLRTRHKLLSELSHFPDVTSAEFYRIFNSELLYSLGVIPTEKMLDDIFKACTYLPWEPFEDTDVLKEIGTPMGILSNFNRTLQEKIARMFPGIFGHIFTSELSGVSKPSQKFYEMAIVEIGLRPSDILYVGDSLKLDMEPATKSGMQVLLIDRDNVFLNFPARISSLRELTRYLNQP